MPTATAGDILGSQQATQTQAQQNPGQQTATGKQSFTFDSFSNGLSLNPNDWKTHGAYCAGLDMIGVDTIGVGSLGIITNARPNTIQLAQSLSPMAVSSTTPLSAMFDWIRRYDGISVGDYFGFDTTTPNIFRYSGTAWVSAKATSAASGGGGLEIFNSSAFYGQNAVLGRITSASYSNNFQTFTVGSATPRPMRIFGGVLNIGNDRYISTVDSTGTFNATALTLPNGYVVRGLEVLVDYLVISADDGIHARIFLWTGGTATFQEFYDIPELTAPPLIQREGNVYAVGERIYELHETSFDVLLPTKFYAETGVVNPAPGSIARWKQHFVFGKSNSNGGFANVDEGGGVWLFGRPRDEYAYESMATQFPESLHMPFLVPPYSSHGVTVGGIYNDNDILVIGYQNVSATNFGAVTFPSLGTKTNSAANAYYVTLPMNFDTDAKKIFHSIKVYSSDSGAVYNEILVYYRLDTDYTLGLSQAAWTLLNTGQTSNYIEKIGQNIPIRQTGRNIQFKFVFTNVSNLSNPAQMRKYTVVYEPLDLYRV